jgi:UPF0271 protein
MSRLVVNCDLGEGFGSWRLGDDAALMAHIDLANIACGAHAGDPTTMRETIRLAKTHGVKVGAHPGYPDLQGFGRRNIEMTSEDLTASVLYQVGALRALLDAEELELNHIKPHGALFGRAARDETVANAVADALVVFGVPVLGMPGTAHESVYTGRGLQFVPEFYADLEYGEDGVVALPLTSPPLDPDSVRERVRRVITEQKAVSRSGREFPLDVQTIGIHADASGAVEVAKALKGELSALAEAEA